MHHRPSILLCDMGDTLIRWTGYDRERGLRSLRKYCDHPERFDLATLVERGIALDRELEERADASLLEFREADFLHAIFGTIGIILRGSDDEVEARYWSEALTFDPEPGVASALERISAAGARATGRGLRHFESLNGGRHNEIGGKANATAWRSCEGSVRSHVRRDRAAGWRLPDGYRNGGRPDLGAVD